MSSVGQVVEVPVVALVDDPGQVRFGLDQLEGLAESLRNGQIHPLIGARQPDGSVRILDGHRRAAAARVAVPPIRSLKVLLVDPPQGEADSLLVALASGIQREALNIVEIGRGLRRLIDATGRTQAEVAAMLGIKESRASKALTILSLSEEDQQKVVSGEIAVTEAYDRARAVRRQESAASSDEQSAAGCKRRPRKGALKRAVAKLAGGASVTVASREMESVDAFVAALEEVVGKARKAKQRGMELKLFLDLLASEAKAAGGSRKG